MCMWDQPSRGSKNPVTPCDSMNEWSSMMLWSLIVPSTYPSIHSSYYYVVENKAFSKKKISASKLSKCCASAGRRGMTAVLCRKFPSAVERLKPAEVRLQVQSDMHRSWSARNRHIPYSVCARYHDNVSQPCSNLFVSYGQHLLR